MNNSRSDKFLTNSEEGSSYSPNLAPITTGMHQDSRINTIYRTSMVFGSVLYILMSLRLTFYFLLSRISTTARSSDLSADFGMKG